VRRRDRLRAMYARTVDHADIGERAAVVDIDQFAALGRRFGHVQSSYT